MLLFRSKFLAALRQGVERSSLRLPPDMSRERFSSLLNRLGRKKWNVHIRARYAHGEGVAAYLARYLRGGPLKNTQILDSSPDRVCFRYRPHRDEEDAGGDSITMNLTAEAFFARYLAHIPSPRLQAVRGYGLYGQRQSARLDAARGALGQPPSEQPKPLRPHEFLERFRQPPEPARCSRCGSILVFISALAHGSAPPPPLH